LALDQRFHQKPKNTEIEQGPKLPFETLQHQKKPGLILKKLKPNSAADLPIASFDSLVRA
jgi:hypothetical protein